MEFLIIIFVVSPLLAMIFLFYYLITKKNTQNDKTDKFPELPPDFPKYKKTIKSKSFVDALDSVWESITTQRTMTKGEYGESLVNRILDNLPVEYQYYHDIYVPMGNGRGYTQIDHVLLSPYGIYVIETKNYKGWIFGKASERHWTQVLRGPRGTTNTYQIYNPIMQNQAHINVLKHYLGLYQSNVFQSIITFSNDCEFKTDDLIRSPFIVYFSQLKKTVTQQKQLKLTIEQIEHATRLLNNLKNLDEVTLARIAQQHKVDVQKKKQQGY